MLGIAFLFFILFSLVVAVLAVGIFRRVKRRPRFIDLFLFLFVSVLLTGLGCGLPLSIPVWLNNQRLQSFADNLYNYPLPPQTEVVNRYAEVGLMGNGNHCDFVVEQNLVSRLSRKEIEAYYQGVELPGARNTDQQINVSVHFETTSFTDKGLHFKLKIIDNDNPPDFDFRCH